jgi:hypothetical protein
LPQMQDFNHNNNLTGAKPHRPGGLLPPASRHIKPIVVAECASSAVSLGAVLAMQHYEHALHPLRDFIAERFIYPVMANKAVHADIDKSDPLLDKARDRATMLVKGGVMVAAGFASHIPIQLALEKQFDPKSFKQVFMGKGAGLGVALGSIAIVNSVMPNLLPAVQKLLCPVLAPFMPQCDDHGYSAAKTACQLMTVEIPSSVISGFVNYGITKRVVNKIHP